MFAIVILCVGAILVNVWRNRPILVTLKENTMNTHKVVIFDFDGTLADTHATLMAIVNNHYADLGCTHLTEEEAQKLRNKPIKEICSSIGISNLRLPMFVFRVKRYMGEVIHQIPLFKGIKESLNRLFDDGYTLGIVSSNTQENIVAFLDQNGIKELFSFIGSSTSLFGKDKVLIKALNNYHLDHASTVYVGDEVRDVLAGKKAGLKTIAVTWGFNDAALLNENHPDLLVDKPLQLHEAAQKLIPEK